MRFFRVTVPFNLSTHNVPRDLAVGDFVSEFELDAYARELAPLVAEITEEEARAAGLVAEPAPPPAVVSL